MIELVIGLALIAGALVAGTGVLAHVAGLGLPDLLPIIGIGGVAGVGVLGALLAIAGVLRLALRRTGARRHALRSARLVATMLLAIACFTLGAPLIADFLNLGRVSGLPLGYYAAAQGGLIALVVLAFAWAARQNRIDAEEPHQ